MNELVTAGIGLLGTALGGAISWVSTERRGRTQTAWEMHREFTGEDMSRSRAAADRVLRRHMGVRWDQLGGVVPAGELDHLWQATSFYERLALAVEHRRINPALVAPLFGNLFTWWYVVGFEPHYVMLHWSTAKHVQRLKAWLVRHAPAADRRHWREKAELSRAAHSAAHGQLAAGLTNGREPSAAPTPSGAGRVRWAGDRSRLTTTAPGSRSATPANDA